MKKNLLTIIFFCSVLGIVSCNSDKFYTPNKIKLSTIDSVGPMLYGEIISKPVNGIFKIDFVDSYLVCITRNNQHFVTLIDTDRDSCHINFCSLGKARNEFINVNSFKQYDLNEKGERILYFANSSKQIKSFNLTQSVKEGRTICDTTHNIDINNFVPFYNNNQAIFKRKNLTYYISLNNPTKFYSPEFIIGNQAKDSIYNIFPKVVTSRNSPTITLDFYESYTQMKPDKTKVVDALICMDYITILDLTTQTSIGIQTNTNASFAKLQDIHIEDCITILNMGVRDLFVTDKHILTLYDSRTVYDGQEKVKPYAPQLIIYDWEGNYVKHYSLNEPLKGCAYDVDKNILYGFDSEENIYKYENVL
ncbi:MAG: BF3164 family lipoprotein [Marinifilaceae bacterium]